MNTNTRNTGITRAERLLALAGITAIPVDRCDDERCPWCEPDTMPFAA